MSHYFTADLRTPANAQWMASLTDLVANGRHVDIGDDGTTVTFTDESLEILATFRDDDNGQFDGAAIWIGGVGHTVCDERTGLPEGRTVSGLAEDMASAHGMDDSAAEEAVRTAVDQIADDPDLWDADRELIIGQGVQIVSDQIAQHAKSTAETSMLEELASVPAQIAELETRRDELVRSLMGTSVPRAQIAEARGTTVARLYQILADKR